MKIKRVCYVKGPETTVYQAISENISRHGMLIKVRPDRPGKLPMPGELIAVEIKLPRNPDFAQKYLRCCGPVARVEGDTVAVRLTRMATTEKPILNRAREGDN